MSLKGRPLFLYHEKGYADNLTKCRNGILGIAIFRPIDRLAAKYATHTPHALCRNVVPNMESAFNLSGVNSLSVSSPSFSCKKKNVPHLHFIYSASCSGSLQIEKKTVHFRLNFAPFVSAFPLYPLWHAISCGRKIILLRYTNNFSAHEKRISSATST